LSVAGIIEHQGAVFGHAALCLRPAIEAWQYAASAAISAGPIW
jgi:hypothetical protein